MALILCVSMALIISILNNYFITSEQNRLASEARLASAGMETDPENYLNNIDTDGYRLTWIDTDGTVLFDSSTTESTMENHGDREEVKEAFAEGEGSASRLSETIGLRTIYHAIRLNDGTVIRIAEDYDTVGILTFRMLSPILIVLVGAIAVSSFIANKLGSAIANPINTIDLDHPLEADTYEEIAPLLVRIDKQNDQIREQLDQLHQKKKEFNSVISNMNEGLILINTHEEIISINSAAMQMFHTDPTVKTITQACRIPEMSELVKNLFIHGSAETTCTIRGRRLQLSGHAITSYGVLTGADIIAYDITEEYEAEQTRREFTANVSHELKTPLQSIMGSAELLENHLVQPKDQDNFIHKIRLEAKRMLNLIDDIIRLSQLDEGAPVETNVLNLSDMANEAKEAVSTIAEQKGVTLHMDLQPAKIRANNRLVYEIIFNLMDNAIRYNKENGTVTVQTYADGNDAIVSVSDTGIGIPEDAINRIFERFYRVDKSHSRSTGGTGLGLSIVKHAVSLCKGQITVKSRPNEGSTFTVRFPIAR